MSRVAGIVFVKIDGQQLKIKANVNCNDGSPKNEMMVGHDGVHGHKSLPQVPFMEGELTVDQKFDVKKFRKIDGATATAQLANGKTFVLRGAIDASEGTIGSEESNMAFRLEGTDAEWIN